MFDNGYSLTNFSGAISDAVSGKTACMFVVNLDDGVGKGRDVCFTIVK